MKEELIKWQTLKHVGGAQSLYMSVTDQKCYRDFKKNQRNGLEIERLVCAVLKRRMKSRAVSWTAPVIIFCLFHSQTKASGLENLLQQLHGAVQVKSQSISR